MAPFWQVEETPQELLWPLEHYIKELIAMNPDSLQILPCLV